MQGLWNFNRWEEFGRFICLFPRNPWQKPSCWNLQAVRLLCEQECKVVMCQMAQSSQPHPESCRKSPFALAFVTLRFPTGATYRYIRYDFLCKAKFATCSSIRSMACQKSRSSVCVRELPPGRSVETTHDNQKCAQTFKQLNRSEPFLQSKPATTRTVLNRGKSRVCINASWFRTVLNRSKPFLATEPF